MQRKMRRCIRDVDARCQEPRHSAHAALSDRGGEHRYLDGQERRGREGVGRKRPPRAAICSVSGETGGGEGDGCAREPTFSLSPLPVGSRHLLQVGKQRRASEHKRGGLLASWRLATGTLAAPSPSPLHLRRFPAFPPFLVAAATPCARCSPDGGCAAAAAAVAAGSGGDRLFGRRWWWGGWGQRRPRLPRRQWRRPRRRWRHRHRRGHRHRYHPHHRRHGLIGEGEGVCRAPFASTRERDPTTRSDGVSRHPDFPSFPARVSGGDGAGEAVLVPSPLVPPGSQRSLTRPPPR